MRHLSDDQSLTLSFAALHAGDSLSAQNFSRYFLHSDLPQEAKLNTVRVNKERKKRLFRMTASLEVYLIRQEILDFDSMARKVLRITLVSLLLFFCAAAIIFWREYKMLKRIETTLQGRNTTEKENIPSEDTPVQAAPQLVKNVVFSRNRDRIQAKVNFRAFKSWVENEPEILRAWGRGHWKVLGDTAAFCLKRVSDNAPLKALGVKSGDCIVELDGESVNQPMRNMGIWMSLAQRKSLEIVALRSRQRITYTLTRF